MAGEKTLQETPKFKLPDIDQLHLPQLSLSAEFDFVQNGFPSDALLLYKIDKQMFDALKYEQKLELLNKCRSKLQNFDKLQYLHFRELFHMEAYMKKVKVLKQAESAAEDHLIKYLQSDSFRNCLEQQHISIKNFILSELEQHMIPQLPLDLQQQAYHAQQHYKGADEEWIDESHSGSDSEEDESEVSSSSSKSHFCYQHSHTAHDAEKFKQMAELLTSNLLIGH